MKYNQHARFLNIKPGGMFSNR